jgi:hypothetical protein
MKKSKTRRWTEKRVENLLLRLFGILSEKGVVDDSFPFERKMLLTNNKGVILQTPDGREFQLTIVDSTR